MSQVIEIKSKSEREQFIQNKRCIIFYSQKSCPACMAIRPLYQRIANRYGDRVIFSILDVDDAKIKLETVPIFEGYYKGEGVKMMEGVDAQSLKQFTQFMINHK